MENESFKILEYEKITAMLEARAGSSLGKEKARRLYPSSDFDEIAEWQQETSEAVNVFALKSPPMGGIYDIRPLLKKAGKGATLDLGEMQEIMSTLYAMRNVKYFFRDLEDRKSVV